MMIAIMTQSRRTFYTICLALTFSGLITNSIRAEDDPIHPELVKIMMKQAEAWNEGDIDGFMEAYWKSDELTFCSGGKVVRGWTATRARYKERYKDKAAMGKLTFSEMETHSLGADVKLMIGRWHLELPQPKSGNYSLVWRKVDGTWCIVHDHSSSDAN
jgi:beta-aspartyl-peptidase (threonine type)